MRLRVHQPHAAHRVRRCHLPLRRVLPEPPLPAALLPAGRAVPRRRQGLRAARVGDDRSGHIRDGVRGRADRLRRVPAARVRLRGGRPAPPLLHADPREPVRGCDAARQPLALHEPQLRPELRDAEVDGVRRGARRLLRAPPHRRRRRAHVRLPVRDVRHRGAEVPLRRAHLPRSARRRQAGRLPARAADAGRRRGTRHQRERGHGSFALRGQRETGGAHAYFFRFALFAFYSCVS